MGWGFGILPVFGADQEASPHGWTRGSDRDGLSHLQPLLPDTGRRGQQWRDHRPVLNGIRWQRRPGAPGRDRPERYGPWRTVSARLVRWRQDGTWDRLLAHVQTKSDADGEVVWEVSVDSTVIRAHQHAAGARKRGSAAPSSDEALGRSRGGLSTKLHVACAGHGRPRSIVLTPGQRHDSTQLEPVLDADPGATPWWPGTTAHAA